MDGMKRHNLFVAGAAICATIVFLDIVQAYAVSWSEDAKIAVGVVGLVLLFAGKALRIPEAGIDPNEKPRADND